METSEISERLSEAAEHGHGHERLGDESFRKRVGILIGVLAVILAVTETAGNASMKETINSNIEASDSYAFYQARNIRQTATRLAADELDALLMTHQDMPAASVAAL